MFGEPNLASEESSREIIPLLQKLIKTIEENGPLPQRETGGSVGINRIQMTQGNFGAGDAMLSKEPNSFNNNQYPQLLQTQTGSGRKLC